MIKGNFNCDGVLALSLEKKEGEVMETINNEGSRGPWKNMCVLF